MVDMSPIGAISPFLTLRVQIEENRTDSLPMFRFTLIKRHEVNKNDMAFMHEEITEEIPALGI